MANLAFFAIGCAFAAEPLVEMFLPNVLGTLPGAISTKRNPVGPLEGPVPPIMLIIDRAGKQMLFAIFASLCMASVGTEDTTFRLLRAFVLQVFATLFYMTNTMMGMPYTLEKEPKKAK